MVIEQQLLIPRETIISAIHSLPYSSYIRVILAADEKKSKKKRKEKRVHKFEEFVTPENYQSISNFLQKLIQQMVSDIENASKSNEKVFTNGVILSFDFSNIKIAKNDDISEIKDTLLSNFSDKLKALSSKFKGKEPDKDAMKELLNLLNTSIFANSGENSESPIFSLIMDKNINDAINIVLSKENIHAKLTGDFKRISDMFGIKRDDDDTSATEEDMKHATEIIENFLITSICNNDINTKPYVSIIEEEVKNNSNILIKKIDDWYTKAIAGHEEDENLGVDIEPLGENSDSDNTNARGIAELVRTIPEFSKKDIALGVFTGRFKLVIIMLAALKNIKASSTEEMLSDIDKQFRQQGLNANVFSEYLDTMYESIAGETDGISNKYLPDESGNKKFFKDDETLQREQMESMQGNSENEEEQENVSEKQGTAPKYDRNGITNATVLKIIDELEKLAADKNNDDAKDYDKQYLFYRLAKAIGILITISSKISEIPFADKDVEEDGSDLYDYKKGSYGQLLSVDYKTLVNMLKDGTVDSYIDSLASSQLINEISADLYDTSKVSIKNIVLGILRDQLRRAYQRLQEMIQNMKVPADNSFDALYESLIVNGIDDELLQFMYMNFSKTLAGRDNILGTCVDFIAGHPLGNLLYKLTKNSVKSFWYFVLHGGADTFYRGVNIAKAYPMQFFQSRYLTDEDIKKIYSRIRYYKEIREALDRLSKLIDPQRESYTYQSSGKSPDMAALRNGNAKQSAEKQSETPAENQENGKEAPKPENGSNGVASSALSTAKYAILAAENEEKPKPDENNGGNENKNGDNQDGQKESLDEIAESNMDTLTKRYASGKTWKPGRVLFTQIEKKFITESNLPIDKFQELLDLLDVKYISPEVDKKLDNNKIVLLTEDGCEKIKETLNGDIASVYSTVPKNSNNGETEITEEQRQKFDESVKDKQEQIKASAENLDSVFSCGQDIASPEKFRKLLEYIEGTVVLVLNQKSIESAQKNIETENITDELSSLRDTLENLRNREKDLSDKNNVEIHDEEGRHLILKNPNMSSRKNLKMLKASIDADYDKAKQFIGDYASYFKYYEVKDGKIKPLAVKDNGEEDHDLKRSKDDKAVMDKIVPPEDKESYENASKNLLKSMQDIFNLFGDRQIINVMAKLTHKAVPFFRYTNIKRGALLPFLKQLATVKKLVQQYEPLQAWYKFKNSIPLTSLHATDSTRDLPTQYLVMLDTIRTTGDAKFADDMKQRETDFSLAMAAVNKYTKNMTRDSPFNSSGDNSFNPTAMAKPTPPPTPPVQAPQPAAV